MIKLFIITPIAIIGSLALSDWLTLNKIHDMNQSLFTLDNGFHITSKIVLIAIVAILVIRGD